MQAPPGRVQASELPQRRQDLAVGEQVRERVVGAQDHVERAAVVVERGPHVRHGEGDGEAAPFRLAARAGDGAGAEIRRRHAVAERGQAQALGADAAGRVQHRAGAAADTRADDGVELRRLPRDAGVPVREDQVEEGREPVVEVGHVRAGSGSR
ncbi:MAG TPA: hypothetical protein VF541_08300 [Longimicrobium sp.]